MGLSIGNVLPAKDARQDDWDALAIHYHFVVVAVVVVGTVPLRLNKKSARDT